MVARGGARHFAKPFVESGLLLNILAKHEDLIRDFRTYESITAQGATDPKGLYLLLDFVEDVLEISPQCEIHAQPLRNALLRLLTSKPALNTTKHSGSIWTHQRSERISVILSHMRRLARSGINNKCAADLTSVQLNRMSKALEKVQLRSQDQPLPCDDESPQPKKKLKKEDTNVSLDSQGYPLFLKTPQPDADEKVTPEKVEGNNAAPSRLLQKRHSQGRIGTTAILDTNLREAVLGNTKKNVLRRPAAAKKATPQKKPAAASESGKKPWLKISRTNASKPERAYLCGTKTLGEKSTLIIEVSRRMSSQYCLIIGKIKEALEKDHLDKAGARALRQELCQQFP